MIYELMYVERRGTDHVLRVGPDIELKCPGCGEWADIDTDQYEGRVSVYHDQAEGGCGWHETHNFREEGVLLNAGALNYSVVPPGPWPLAAFEMAGAVNAEDRKSSPFGQGEGDSQRPLTCEAPYDQLAERISAVLSLPAGVVFACDDKERPMWSEAVIRSLLSGPQRESGEPMNKETREAEKKYCGQCGAHPAHLPEPCRQVDLVAHVTGESGRIECKCGSADRTSDDRLAKEHESGSHYNYRDGCPRCPQE